MLGAGLAIAAGVLVAGAISGATGQAFPLIAAPIFLLAYPAPEAVGLTAMCSLTGQLFSTALLRRSINYKVRGCLISAGLLGAGLGTALLADCNPHVVRVVLGLLILLSGLWALLRRPAVRHPHKPRSHLVESVVGLCGGLTGGLAGTAGVVPAIWCATRGLDKHDQRAVTQPFIMAVQLASLLALCARGIVDLPLASVYLTLLIPLLAGVGIGVVSYRLMSSHAVTRALLSIITASGLVLLLA